MSTLTQASIAAVLAGAIVLASAVTRPFAVPAQHFLIVK
jgi:hypothetical protein